jgi:hypothetical protein
MLLGFAIAEDNIALDPPSANYKKVEQPAPVLWSPTGNKSIDQVFSDCARVISLDIAKLHAMERFEAATLAGDTAWAATQQSAYQSYATQADAVRTVLPRNNIVLKNSFPPVSVKSYPGGAAALPKAYNTQSGKPLDAADNKILLSLGLTQAQINKAVSEVAQALRPSDINTYFGALPPTP